MSKTAVIVALLVAVVLGVAAIVLTGGKGPATVAGPLLAFEPSAASEIRVDFPDGSFQTARRAEGGWNIVLGQTGKPERSWPAAQTQIHAALRIFSNLKPEQPADGKVTRPTGTLTIKAGDATQTLKISDQRLAGRVLVESGSGAAWVDADVAEMLINTGVKAWRDPAAFPGIGTSPFVVQVSGTNSGLSLIRVQGKWGLRVPFQEPADPESLSRLFTILSSVKIVDFCDQAPPTHTGLDAPIATLELMAGLLSQSDRAKHEHRWALSVGAAAGIADNTFVAQVTHNDSTQVVIVAGEQLAAISTDPLQYVSRQPLRVEPTDVGNIVIKSPDSQLPCQRAEFRRTLEGWESRCELNDWKPAPKSDAQAAEALIELCTTTLPDRLELRSKRQVSGAVATVEVNTAGGTPLGTFSILIDGTRLTIMNDNVFRDYAAGAGKTVAEWLGRR
jgi:hypothetical protein